MKTPALIVPLLLVAFAITSENLNAQQSNGYSANLISPRLGQVLYPWRAIQDRVDSVSSQDERTRVRDGASAVVGWRQDVLDVDYDGDASED
jgi:hypothetical protein